MWAVKNSTTWSADSLVMFYRFLNFQTNQPTHGTLYSQQSFVCTLKGLAVMIFKTKTKALGFFLASLIWTNRAERQLGIFLRRWESPIRFGPREVFVSSDSEVQTVLPNLVDSGKKQSVLLPPQVLPSGIGQNPLLPTKSSFKGRLTHFISRRLIN